MKIIINSIERITNSAGFIGGWLLVPLVLSACYEVFSRYVLQSPTIWAFEMGYMLTGANFLLGMAYTLRIGGHIRIDVLHQYFSARIKAVIDLLTYAFIVVPICAVLALAMGEHAFNSYLSDETTGQSAWNPMIWPFRAVQALCVGLLSLQGVASLLRAINLLRKDKSDFSNISDAQVTAVKS